MASICSITLLLLAANAIASGTRLNSTILEWSQEYSIETIGILPEGPIVVITNRGTGKCVDNRDGYNNNGNPTQMYDCNHTSSQMWIRMPRGDYFQLKNISSGKCIDVNNQSPSNGAELHQWDCHGQYSQHWREYSRNHIIGRHSGKCIDIQNQNSGNSARLHISSCSIY